MFGTEYDTDEHIRSLDELGIERVFEGLGICPSLFYKSFENLDTKTELKKLNRELLDTFMLVVKSLTDDPTQVNWIFGLDQSAHIFLFFMCYTYLFFHTKASPHISRMRLLLTNMHHLINGYRPHQARDSLKLMMKAQVESRKSAIEMIDLYKKIIFVI